MENSVNNYVNKFGLYDVKPVKEDGLPTGNDGWILTAYARKLGLPVRHGDLIMTFKNLAWRPTGYLPVERLPGKLTPFVSRDVVLGWYLLGLIHTEKMIAANWSFSPIALPPFGFFQFFKEAISCIGKDRNYFWMNGKIQMYHAAFKVPIQDRAFMLRDSYLPVPLHYRIYEWFSRTVLKSKSDSSRLIAWAKGYEKLDLDVVLRYFGENHPITIQVRDGLYIGKMKAP